MNAYKKSGVDVELGDFASKSAYDLSKETFSSRDNLFGNAVCTDGGFSGLINFGDFYLAQSTDGVGTKMVIAESILKFDTLGQDLLAMVCDDIICVGAETVSIVNSIDINKVDKNITDSLLAGLRDACKKQKIIISGGEIAEVGDCVNSIIWNASAFGIVKKNKLFDKKNIKRGDFAISIKEDGFRSNGFSLIRKILFDRFGDDCFNKKNKDGEKWGELVLKPSIIYSNAILKIIGRYGKKEMAKIKGIAHITGGGIENNICRIMPKNFKIKFDNLFDPPKIMKEICEMGKLKKEDISKTFNMGNGMILICSKNQIDKIIEILHNFDLKAKVCGKVI